MIVILKPGAQKARVEALMTQIKQQGVDIHYSQGTTETILGLVGDTTHVDEDWLRASDIVEDVRRVSEPYKLANRRFHPKDTHVNVSGRVIGEGTFAVIAGPCSVESREQLVSIAEDVKRAAQPACAAARLNRAHRRIPSRDLRTKDSSFCWKRSGKRVCRLSRRS